MNRKTCLAALAAIALGSGAGRLPAQSAGPAPPMKPLYVLEDSYLKWPSLPSEKAYDSIDGKHLKQYVEAQAAISRRYRDNGHPQFWGRIAGTEADAESAKWMLDQFRRIGLSDVHEQPFDMPPQWIAQSWNVTASGGGKDFVIQTAQPTHRSEATTPAGLDLEALDVNLATPGDLNGRDLKGKAVFFYSTDFMSRHVTISGGAIKRIEDAGAAAIFTTLMIPGNLRFQFYPVNSKVPTFALGYEDGMAVREMIGKTRGAQPVHIKVRLDVKMVPNLKTSTVWGTLPGATDETVILVAHRDGWFEGANDNGTGVATMLGLAEYFVKVPKEQRKRTIVFLGTNGHHDGTAESGTWLLQHKEVFAKTAVLINCEHTSATQLVSYNGVIRKVDQPTPFMWNVGGSHKLEQIAMNAYQTFGVATYDLSEASAGGEIGRFQTLAPALQVIDTGLYWHSDHETPDIIPPTGLAAVTRAYAKIINDTASVSVQDLQRPPKL
jgi:hypothetical protein